MKKSDRDAILAKLRQAALEPHSPFDDDVIDILGLLVNALPVEEENLTKPRGDAPQDGTESGMQETQASPGAALSSAEPDFAAEAYFAQVMVPDAAWWKRQAGAVMVACRLQPLADRDEIAALLERTFAAAPAFDVEAFRREVQRRCDAQTGAFSAGKIAADVAREMWLGRGGA